MATVLCIHLGLQRYFRSPEVRAPLLDVYGIRTGSPLEGRDETTRPRAGEKSWRSVSDGRVPLQSVDGLRRLPLLQNGA